jgi:hypothetical protein
MSDYKAYFKQKMERMKSTAAQLISTQDEECAVTLQPETYERAREWAEEHHTNVQAVVNEMLDRFLSSNQSDSQPITRERQERNPLLLLDGLCEREL